MLNPSAYALGANRSCIRDLFEYGCQRAAVVGRENVYDYSLGNPSIPSPKEVDETVRQLRAIAERHRIPRFRIGWFYSEIPAAQIAGRIDAARWERSASARCAYATRVMRLPTHRRWPPAAPALRCRCPAGR